jgi:hypothetical protein
MAIGALLAAMSSCSVTRHIPEGQYLLTRSTISVDKSAPRRERVSAGELDRYVVQSPNRRFLGTNLYASIYAGANPQKNYGWQRFLRRTGEPPVVWDPARTEQSRVNLETSIASRGFFEGEVEYRIDTVRRKKVRVEYTVRQGAPWRIGGLRYSFRDSLLQEPVMAEMASTGLRSGAMFDIDAMERERERIATDLKNAGYWDFGVDNITFEADSTRGDHTVDINMIVHPAIGGYRADGTAIREPHRVYRLNNIFVRPDFDPLATTGATLDTVSSRGLRLIYDGRLEVRPRVLRRAIRLHSGRLYSASGVAETSAELMRLGAFRSVSLVFSPLDVVSSSDPGAPYGVAGASHPVVAGASSRVVDSVAVSLPHSVAANPQASPQPNQEVSPHPGERLLDVDIRGVPALRQSVGVDLEGSTTSDFYGLRATLGYQNRNTFHGAELFDASLTGGFEFLKSSERKLSYELGGSVSLSFPRLVFWVVERNVRVRNPLSTLTLSTNWQDRAYYSRTLFGLSWGYGWGIRRFENLTLRPLDISLVRMGHIDDGFIRRLNNPYLVAAYDDQLIAGVSASYTLNNQPRDLEAGAVVLRVNVETTGNLLSGLAHAFGRPVVESAPENAAGSDLENTFGSNLENATGSGVGDDGSAQNVGGAPEPAVPKAHYEVLGIRFSQYVRGDVSFSQKIVLGGKTSLAYRVQAGAIYSYGNSTSPPFDKFFYAGGAGSMRGWAVRTLGPGTVPYVRQSYPAQMGDVKFEFNAEIRFPVVKSLNGALFFDAGNIWFMHSRPDQYPDEAVFRLGSFARQLGFNTGLGVRADLRFVVLRLDWGIRLHDPGRAAGQRWISDFRWRNTALNFGVGYPF